MSDEIDWTKLESEAGADLPPVPITVPMMDRRIVWNTVPCNHAAQVVDYLGLSPASGDVEAMEHSRSHDRLDALQGYGPLLLDLSRKAARSITAATIIGDEHADENVFDVESEVFKKTAEQFHGVIYQASLAIIAELIDLKALHTPHFRIVTFVPPGDES